MLREFRFLSMATLALCLGAAASVQAQAPANDLCGGAIDVAVPSVTAGTTTDATADAADLLDGGGVAITSCGTGISAPGVWYTFEGTGGDLVVSLCGSAYDTRLSIFTGSCGAFTCLDGNDDACGLQSEVTVSTAAATTYYVLVNGFNGQTGDFTLTIDEPPPANDTCGDAAPVGDGDVIQGTTADNNPDAESLGCGDLGTPPTEWYQVTGLTGGETVTASLCGSSFDTKISAHNGFCGDLECIRSNDDFCDTQSEITFEAPCSGSVFLRVFGFNTGNSGDYTLSVTVTPAVVTNDTCAEAIAVSFPSSTLGNTDSATLDAADVPVCGGAVTAPGVWYTTTGTGGPMQISLCDSSYDTKLHVYTGGCGVGTLVCETDNDDFCGTRSGVVFDSVLDTTYYILVSGWMANTGCYTLDINHPTPDNDDCFDAEAVLIGDSAVGTTLGASFDDVGTCGTSNTGPGVWYSFEGNDGPVTVSTCGAADFDTKIGVFSGTCGTLACVAGNDDQAGCAGNSSEIVVQTVAGETYLVLVHGFQSQSGDFTLSLIGDTPAPPNDLCDGAEALSVPTQRVVSNLGSSGKDGVSCAGGGGDSENSVWYSFEGTGDELSISIDNAGTTVANPEMALYTGTCDALTCVGGGLVTTTLQSEAGTTYTLRIGAADQGDIEISITGPAPANDACADAIEILPNTVTPGRTTFASVSMGSADFCGTSLSAPGVWYSFTGTGFTTFVFTCGPNTDYDTKLHIFTDGCDTLTCVAGNDDACASQSGVGFVSELDREYLVLVSGFGGAVGNFELTYESEPPPANDVCATAEPITLEPDADGGIVGDADVPVSGSASGSTIFATASQEIADLACHASFSAPVGGAVWYVVEGTGNDMTASTCLMADYDTQISVFSGDCGALTCVGSNDDGEIPGDPEPTDCGLTSYFTFPTDEGTTYYIVVTGFGGNVGEFDLTVSSTDTPVLGGRQVPGDINQDGSVDISDGARLFGFLFAGNPVSLPCGDGTVTAAGNVGLADWNDDLNVDISDGIGLLNYLFTGGDPHVLGIDCIEIVECPDVCVAAP